MLRASSGFNFPAHCLLHVGIDASSKIIADRTFAHVLDQLILSVNFIGQL